MALPATMFTREQQVTGGKTSDAFGGPPGGGGYGAGGGATQICFDWQKGRCTRGDNCRYSHDVQSFAVAHLGGGRLQEQPGQVGLLLARGVAEGRAVEAVDRTDAEVRRL